MIDAQVLGKEIAKGMMIQFGKNIAMLAFIIGMLAIGAAWLTPKDNSDPPDGRSGLQLYTDNLTGVQYVGSRHGLAVRVDQDGRPVVVEVQ